MSLKSNVVFDICEEVTLLSLLFVVAVLYFLGTDNGYLNNLKGALVSF